MFHKHDWILVADVLHNKDFQAIFPTRRYCDICGKEGNSADADYSKIHKTISEL